MQILIFYRFIQIGPFLRRTDSLNGNKDIDSKFRFVILASMRAKELLRGAKPKIKSRSKNLIRIAQEEVRRGLVDFEIAPHREEKAATSEPTLFIGEKITGSQEQEKEPEPEVKEPAKKEKEKEKEGKKAKQKKKKEPQKPEKKEKITEADKKTKENQEEEEKQEKKEKKEKEKEEKEKEKKQGKKEAPKQKASKAKTS